MMLEGQTGAGHQKIGRKGKAEERQGRTRVKSGVLLEQMAGMMLGTRLWSESV